MEVTVQNLQKKFLIRPRRIKQITEKILRRQKISSASLSIVFVSDRRIRVLNKKYLRHNYVTDVLSFNLHPSPRQSRKFLHGEIVISADTAFKNAKFYRTNFQNELTLYVIHGVLHLLGYDDHSPSDIQKMRQKEQELLSFLGI